MNSKSSKLKWIKQRVRLIQCHVSYLLGLHVGPTWAHDALYKWTFYLLTWPDDTFIGSCYVRLLFYQIYLTLFDFPAGDAECIGVASMGHWGTCHPRFPFNFLGHFSAAQTLSLDSTWLLTRTKIKNIQASIVTVYCMNGCQHKIIFS